MTRICVDDIKYMLDNNNETITWDYGYVAGLQFAGIIDIDDAMILNTHIATYTCD